MSAAGAQGSDQTEPGNAHTGVQGSPRVRGSSPAIAEAIEHALERSSTFQQLVATINGTDGIVYVHEGQCGRDVLSCLLLTVTQAGPNRILHIKVDRRRKGRALMVTIGHELRHAVEVLNERTVIDDDTARLFYERVAPTLRYSFETEAAIQTELDIDAELGEGMRRR